MERCRSHPAADPDAPLSGMVAVVFRDPGPTTADNLSDYLKQLVALYNTDRTRLHGLRFPLENAITDTVRVLDGLRHNVVVKWLDPLTFADGPAAPRFGANADFLAYFGDGWNADWACRRHRQPAAVLGQRHLRLGLVEPRVRLQRGADFLRAAGGRRDAGVRALPAARAGR